MQDGSKITGFSRMHHSQVQLQHRAAAAHSVQPQSPGAAAINNDRAGPKIKGHSLNRRPESRELKTSNASTGQEDSKRAKLPRGTDAGLDRNM